MIIHARPNRNGNTPEHFMEAARRCLDASRAIENAISCLTQNVVHGRNYQTVANPAAERKMDITTIDRLRTSAGELRNMAMNLAETASAAKGD
jgi:hypothetical protein